MPRLLAAARYSTIYILSVNIEDKIDALRHFRRRWTVCRNSRLLCIYEVLVRVAFAVTCIMGGFLRALSIACPDLLTAITKQNDIVGINPIAHFHAR